jgi:hypothetical protein
MKRTLLVLVFALIQILAIGQKVPSLKVSDNKRYIVTRDNEPFFWLGGTAWELIHRLTREEVDLYINDRKGKGFTIIQTVVLAELNGLNTPNAYGHKPLIDNDPTKINETYFEHVDYVIKQAEKNGMYIGLLPTWGDKYHKAWGVGPEIFTPENAKTFGMILSKRYSDKTNIVWILGGDRWPEDDEDRAIVNAMAEGIRTHDTSNLITFHPNGSNLATNFFNESWLDFDMFQAGHDRTGKDYEFVWKSLKVEPARPVVNGEPRYENHPDRFKPEVYGWMDDSDVRSSAYWTMLAGAAGYTYGSHDIWQMYSVDKTPVNGARTDWKESLKLPGSGQLQYMKNLLTTFPWQQMVNDQSLILNENKSDSTYIIAAVSINKDFMLIYTPMGKPVTPDLTKLNAGKVIAFWFNPRDGLVKRINEYNTTEKIEFKPWSAGRGSDFVLVIMDEYTNYRLPGYSK